MSHGRGAARRNGLLRRLLAATAIGVTAVSALALFGRSFWIFELMSHFRLQWLAVELPLLLVFLWQRDGWLLALTAPLTVVNASALIDYWPRSSSGVVTSTGPVLDLWSVYLYIKNHDYGRFLSLAKTQLPDVLVLLEVDAGWAAALDALTADYPIRVIVPRESSFGIAVLSRLPLIAPATVDLDGAPAIDTGIALGDGHTVRLVAVHLQSPSSASRAAQRNRQLDVLAGLLDGDTRPRIVAGDFNSTPYSPFLADWLDRTGLRDLRRGRGPGASWPTYFPPLAIPIDHYMLSDEFEVVRQQRGPAFGSDHYPLEARLSLRGGQRVH
jgi:endonuclease/exonuclease/phosphatase (EEP) superfamily protein YafD